MKRRGTARALRKSGGSNWLVGPVLFGWSLLAGLLALTITVAVTALAFRASTGVEIWDVYDKGHPEIFDALKIGLTSAAGSGAAVALVVAFRRQRLLEQDREGQRNERRAVHERYQAATAQLGHENLTIRLAGVYALAAVADDWLELNDRGQAQVCVDVVCGYVRTPPAAVGDDGSQPDLEVRQTITRVIAQHLQTDAHPSWHGFDLDFTGATFTGNHKFDGATFSGERVSFGGATFSGERVSFDGATFSSKAVSFLGATFSSKAVSFDGATFSGEAVSFLGATFSGEAVSFGGATFEGKAASFLGATFSGEAVSFDGVTFSGKAVFFDWATFSAKLVSFGSLHPFHSPMFSKRASFDWATLSRKVVSSDSLDPFRSATFSGELVSFYRVTFMDGAVSFDGATFSGERVSFDKVTFSGGCVRFIDSNPTDGGGIVHGPWPSPPASLPSSFPREDDLTG